MANDYNCNFSRYVDTVDEVEVINLDEVRDEIFAARAEKQVALDNLNTMMKEFDLKEI